MALDFYLINFHKNIDKSVFTPLQQDNRYINFQLFLDKHERFCFIVCYNDFAIIHLSLSIYILSKQYFSILLIISYNQIFFRFIKNIYKCSLFIIYKYSLYFLLPCLIDVNTYNMDALSIYFFLNFCLLQKRLNYYNICGNTFKCISSYTLLNKTLIGKNFVKLYGICI